MPACYFGPMRPAGSPSPVVGLLLGVFALVLAPRDWLHHCDQEGVDHHHPATAALQADLDCEICQALIATFEHGRPSPELPAMAAVRLQFAEVVTDLVPGRDREAASRGPPMA